jgi:hypothetical protein
VDVNGAITISSDTGQDLIALTVSPPVPYRRRRLSAGKTTAHPLTQRAVALQSIYPRCTSLSTKPIPLESGRHCVGAEELTRRDPSHQSTCRQPRMMSIRAAPPWDTSCRPAAAPPGDTRWSPTVGLGAERSAARRRAQARGRLDRVALAHPSYLGSASSRPALTTATSYARRRHVRRWAW